MSCIRIHDTHTWMRQFVTQGSVDGASKRIDTVIEGIRGLCPVSLDTTHKHTTCSAASRRATCTLGTTLKGERGPDSWS